MASEQAHAVAPSSAAARERRTLAAAATAHILHDGYTDLLYVLLPVWQAEFGLGFADPRQDANAGSGGAALERLALAPGAVGARRPWHRLRRPRAGVGAGPGPTPRCARTGDAAGAAQSASAAPPRHGFALLLAIAMIDSAGRSGFLTFLPFLLKAKEASIASIGSALSLLFVGGAAGKLVLWLSRGSHWAAPCS
jgi:hypothetical protein